MAQSLTPAEQLRVESLACFILREASLRLIELHRLGASHLSMDLTEMNTHLQLRVKVGQEQMLITSNPLTTEVPEVEWVSN